MNDVKPVPPLATGKVPVTPDVKGKPVRFVAVPLAGVPNIAPLPKVVMPETVKFQAVVLPETVKFPVIVPPALSNLAI